ncbi:hypothetical protein SAMN04488029_3950 [Reichenbachiella faecimaris]|uniref:Uncharacterized protein n=1 Tax=Reichenbachiella faecimaris TaxID=692418 RepID=A0A1W2GQK1_REIFA|nr:hypothetical protein [Reichenbachiella faecimaris]SMD38933.1 hypothetical protein SAMN04488029_3950 [Reichenbachiella faecimaris]
MKKGLFTIVNCFIGLVLFAQDFTDNGKNLSTVCPAESCIHISFNSTIYFPFEEDRVWEIRNMEVATKFNGNFLATGDLYVYGKDTAAILSLDLVFYADDDSEVYRMSKSDFEFYNEPASAEPIIFVGKMSQEEAELVRYVDLEIKDSKRLPYYEIDSDCYHACKEHKLKEAIKDFKKSK